MKIRGKTFLLTGGGSGIGRALCLQLVKQGAAVVILDVKDDGMQQTIQLAGKQGNQITAFRVNLENKDEIIGFHQEFLKSGGAIDGLINNAGIIQPFVPINELSNEIAERIFKINFFGTFYLTKIFLPHMLSRPEAHIVNIASMGGFIPFPGQTIYSAAKAAVKIFTEGLYAELLNTKVHITLVMPGAVNTNISANSEVTLPESHRKNAGSTAYKALSPEKAAQLILSAMEKNKSRVLVGNDARFLDLFYRLTPSGAIRYLVSKMKNLQ